MIVKVKSAFRGNNQSLFPLCFCGRHVQSKSKSKQQPKQKGKGTKKKQSQKFSSFPTEYSLIDQLLLSKEIWRLISPTQEKLIFQLNCV